MNNLRKRILSLFLVGTMTLSMASPFSAFAEEGAMEGDLSVTAQEQGASSTAQKDTPVSEAATSDDQASALLEEAVTESTTPTPAADATPAPQTEGEQPLAEVVEPETTPTEKQETVSAQDAAAQIGEVYYATLADAVAAAEAGQTITLLQNVQLQEAITVDQDLTLVAESGSAITLSRGEGYTGALFVLNDGVLTLGESASENAGSLVLDGGARWLVDRVVTDAEGQPLHNEQGQEEKETVEAESPAVPEAYDANEAAEAALLTVTKGELVLQQTVTLQNNHSKADGGAITTTAGDDARIHVYGKVINNATDGNGGGYSGNGRITVYGTAEFSGNNAAENGGAFYLYGDGVAESIRDQFTGNAAGGNGGALWLDGKALLEEGTFSGNRAARGGALYAAASEESHTIRLRGGTFTGNEAQTGADAVLVPDDSPSDYGWVTVSGGVMLGDAYLGAGKYLAVEGALSGSVNLTVGGRPDRRSGGGPGQRRLYTDPGRCGTPLAAE